MEGLKTNLNQHMHIIDEKELSEKTPKFTRIETERAFLRLRCEDNTSNEFLPREPRYFEIFDISTSKIHVPF
jgi:hypothetical protein